MLRRILSAEAYEVLLILALFSLSILFLAHLLGVDSVTTLSASPFDAGTPRGWFDRQVGYAFAVNWSIVTVVIFPICAYFMVAGLKSTERALDRISKRRMLVDHRGRPVVRGLKSSWVEGSSGRDALFLWIGLIVPLAISVGEWASNNLLRLLKGAPPFSWSPAEFRDYDWGLVGVMRHWTLAGRLANAGLDLAAFLYQGLELASFIAFFLLFLSLSRILLSPGPRANLILIPDLDSPEVRMGFEEFAEPMSNMLAVSLMACIICYLLRLENLYLDSPSATNIYSFLLRDGMLDLATRATEKHEVRADDLKILLDPGTNAIRGFLGCVLSVLISFCAFIILFLTVRRAARRAKQDALDMLEAEPTLLQLPSNCTVEELRDKIRKMEVWPIGWPGQTLLLIWMCAMVVTLVYYRIGIYFVLATIASGIVYYTSKIPKLFSKSA